MVSEMAAAARPPTAGADAVAQAWRPAILMARPVAEAAAAVCGAQAAPAVAVPPPRQTLGAVAAAVVRAADPPLPKQVGPACAALAGSVGIAVQRPDGAVSGSAVLGGVALVRGGAVVASERAVVSALL